MSALRASPLAASLEAALAVEPASLEAALEAAALEELPPQAASIPAAITAASARETCFFIVTLLTFSFWETADPRFP